MDSDSYSNLGAYGSEGQTLDGQPRFMELSEDVGDAEMGESMDVD